jgi:brefeldin A-resistance guanine nucleotide exchange factor 1
MKELALTSLVEFCNEPALMMDLYYNYDCDVHCSNLFEIVCSTIAAQVKASSDPTIPLSTSDQKVSSSSPSNVAECAHNNTGTSALHRLAFEGILAVVDGIAKRCSVGNRYYSQQQQQLTSPPESNTSNVFFSTDVNKDSELLINDGSYHSISSNCKISMQSPIDPYVLQRRKQKKRNLALVAAQFNKNPFTDWIQYALSLDIFEDDITSPVSARSVAKFLYDTPNLDKTQVGLYLSKGPKEKYPFNAEVLREFTSLFDFTHKSHAANDAKKSLPDDTLVEEGLFTSISDVGSERLPLLGITNKGAATVATILLPML